MFVCPESSHAMADLLCSHIRAKTSCVCVMHALPALFTFHVGWDFSFFLFSFTIIGSHLLLMTFHHFLSFFICRSSSYLLNSNWWCRERYSLSLDTQPIDPNQLHPKLERGGYRWVKLMYHYRVITFYASVLHCKAITNQQWCTALEELKIIIYY